MKVRRPCQAGTFYAETKEALKAQIEKCFIHTLGPGSVPKLSEKGLRQIVGIVSPHAGYMYSGPVAAHGYYNVALDGKPDVVVIFGPNHTGYGSGLAIMREGVWRTPLGDVEIDSQTADEILRESNIIDVDEEAHFYEHSIEVQLPFLQYLFDAQFKFIPICFLMQDLASSHEVGHAVAKALKNKNALVIASTDMTHYEPHERAKSNDLMAIEAVKKFDEAQFYSIIEEHGISACGYGPVVALVVAAKELGAKKAELLSYRTSGEVTGDYSAVVGYASICFKK